MNRFENQTNRKSGPSGAHGYDRDERYDWQREMGQQPDWQEQNAPFMQDHMRAEEHSQRKHSSQSRKQSSDAKPSRYAQPKSTPRSSRSRGKHKGENRPVRKRRIARILLRIFLCLLLFVFVAGGFWGFITVRSIIREAPELTAAAVTPTEEATYIYNADGSRDLKLTLPESNRDLVDIENVPIYLQQAFVAIEDARFYRHNGIDLKGIARAFIKGVTSGSFSEGASTITQQLIKNSVLTGWTNEKTLKERFRRKIQEQYLALQLEKMLTKDQILQDYMNTINLGAGCYGIQSAAYRYFGKDVADLTLSEAAVIAGITQNPTRYNPILYPENNASRREAVLQAMLKQGYITEAELEEALADDVYSRIQSNEDPSYSTNSIYTSYQDALISQVIEDLQSELGFSYKQAVKAVYSGGLKIYSAQDDTIQQIVDEEMLNEENFPAGTQVGIDYALSVEDADGAVTHYGNEHLRSFVRKTQSRFNLLCNDESEARALCESFRQSVVTEADTVLGERITITPQPQASVVVIDQSTGYVKAISGGRGEKSASLTLNRAVSSLRQPGSTFKILAAFAPALENWGKTLATTYENTAYEYADGTSVSNWDLNDYGGTVTIREAITRSVNTAAVRCLTEITPQSGYNFLLKFGFSSLVAGETTESGYMTDIGQALVLGGLTNGVSNLELCAAYAAIANEGTYLTPVFYTKVTDPEGNILLDQTSRQGESVLSSSTAWLLTDAMRDVIESEDGTAHDYIDTGSMPSAGKSGTTDSYRDVWFTGYTPYYTLSVWGGYDNNSPLGNDSADHEYDKVLWNAIMNRIDDELALPAISFRKSADIVNISVCRDSGMVAVSGCDAYVEYFSTSNQPLIYCPVHGSGMYVSRGISEANNSITSGGNVQLPEIVIQSDSATATTDTSQSSTTGNDEIVIYSEDSASIPADNADNSDNSIAEADPADQNSSADADSSDIIADSSGTVERSADTSTGNDGTASDAPFIITIEDSYASQEVQNSSGQNSDGLISDVNDGSGQHSAEQNDTSQNTDDANSSGTVSDPELPVIVVLD